MSLTSSLFSGISGLSTMGNSMQIIGDNIANVNTIGFKGSSYSFQDLLSQATATQSGTSQIGRGTALGDIYSSFQQGSFESTGNTTDLGIGGDGFFILREEASDRVFYTRAGNFRFDKDGYLINPEGYVVQGWVLDEEGDDEGSITDIRLSSFTSAPEETDQITIISNLDSDEASNTAWLTNAWNGTNTPPIANTNYEYQATVKVYDSLGSAHDVTVYYDRESATSSIWDYIVTCNPSEDNRSFITGATDPRAGLLARGLITFSDSAGTILPSGLTMETLTEAATTNTDYIQGLNTAPTYSGTNGFTALNTTITVNDYNSLSFTDTGITPTRDAAGVWTLPGADPAGPYLNARIYPPPLNIVAAGAAADFNDTYTFTVTTAGTVGAGVPLPVLSWTSATGGSSGTVTAAAAATAYGVDGTFTLTFPAGGVATAGDTFTITTGAAGAPTITNVPTDSGFSIDLFNSATSAATSELTLSFATAISGAGSIGLDINGASTNWVTETANTNGYLEFDADFIGAATNATLMSIEFDIGTQWDGTAFENDSLTTTQFARSSTTTFQSADGYGAGDFQGVDVDVDGIMTGIYSNGQLIPLNRVALAKFINDQELHKEGGNLYRETRDSGDAITGHPGNNGLGDLSPNSLEQSNVDIANEFVKMITSQRGFQANSKIITTVDQMLAEVIGMKR